MTALTAAMIWLTVVNVIGLLPSRDHHWRAAYGLIAAGIPIVGFVTWQQGPLVGLLVLAAGASVLRWPVYYLWLWVKRVAGRAGP